jgi:scaffold protein (connect acetoacetyl-CoA thiolase and HMG-CoA synthase)
MERELKENLFDKNLFTEADGEIRLRGSECPGCGRRFFPPKARCPECFQSNLRSVALDGRGTLYSYTTVFIPSRNFKPPYTVGYVELDKGVRVFGQIRARQGESLVIGSPVKAVIDYLWKGSDGRNVSGYLFEPARE